MKSKTVGIIGGGGVAATNKLNDIIEKSFTKNGAFRDAHHPEIITFQAVNVPSRSMFLEGKGDTFVRGYVDIGLRLKSSGATVLCMCCNTAHSAIDEIQMEVGLPFINMVAEVVKTAKVHGLKRIGLMTSDGCRIGKVYDNYFYQYFPTAQIIYPDIIHQKEVTRGIVNVKNKNRFLPANHADRPKQIFINVCDHLVLRGAQVIISGCTDIAVDFLPDDYQNYLIIDSLSILADKIASY